MKKITIIFIIVFRLLSCVEVSYMTAEPLNYGEYWNSLSDNEKHVYLLGMRNGMMEGVFNCLMQIKPYFKDLLLEEETWEKAEEKIRLWESIYTSIFSEYNEHYRFFASNRNVIIKIVTDIYKDPANTYISNEDILFLASLKLKGESIESSLRELREKALP